MYEENEEFEEELDMGDCTGLHLIYDWLPYSHQRIKEILKEHCNAYLVPYRGYKLGRNIPNYKQNYEIRDITTDKVINERINLDALRKFFAKREFPLHRSNRNKKAANFLQAVKEFSDND